MKRTAIAGLALSVFVVACAEEVPTSADEGPVGPPALLGPGTPCNGTAGTSCEITNVVPTGSLVCSGFGCPPPQLPRIDGNKSGVPSHVVIVDADFYVVRHDQASCCGSGDVVRIEPGGTPTGLFGTILGSGFMAEGLAFDPISQNFYSAQGILPGRVFSIPKAGIAGGGFPNFFFGVSSSPQQFDEGVAVDASGTVFATARNFGGTIWRFGNLPWPARTAAVVATGFGIFPRGFTIDASDNFYVVGTESSGRGYVVRMNSSGSGRFDFAREFFLFGQPFFPEGSPAVTPSGDVIVTTSPPASSVLLMKPGPASGVVDASLIHAGFPFFFPSGTAIDGEDILVIDQTGTLFRISGALNSPPVADADGAVGPYTGFEGTAVAFDGSLSDDPDGDQITLDWVFGDPLDPTPGSGATPLHTYADDGVFNVTLTVTDIPAGLTDVAVTTATISNVLPTVNLGPDVTILEGETFDQSGSFTDPGADMWTGQVDYDDGAGLEPLTLVGMSFDLNHPYANPDIKSVEVRVFDDDGFGSSVVTVTVLSFQQATQNSIDDVQDLINLGDLDPDKGEDAIANLQTAVQEFDKPDDQAALGAIGGAVGDLQAAVDDGLLDPGVGNSIMDQLAGIARQVAVNARDQAVACDPANPGLAGAQQALDAGDAERVNGKFKDAVNKYKDALAKAEGVVASCP